MLDWHRGWARRPRVSCRANKTGPERPPFPPWRSTVVITTERVRLADHTTLHLGGPATRFVAAGSQDELVTTVRAPDAAAEPVPVLAPATNLAAPPPTFPTP